MVPIEWLSACIAPLYKGKGDKNECSASRDISLLSVVGKFNGRVPINGLETVWLVRVEINSVNLGLEKVCRSEFFSETSLRKEPCEGKRYVPGLQASGKRGVVDGVAFVWSERKYFRNGQIFLYRQHDMCQSRARGVCLVASESAVRLG